MLEGNFLKAAMAQSLPTPSLASFDVHEFALKPPQVYNDGSKTCRFARKRRAELAMIFAFCAHSAAFFPIFVAATMEAGKRCVEVQIDVNRGSELADTAPTRAGNEAMPTQDFVTTVATIGVIAAGVALFEVALIPRMMIGGAAVLASKLAPRRLPKLRRRLQPLFNSTVRRRIMPAVPLPDRPDVKAPLAARPRFAIRQALAKTVTFRIIVTTLEFTWNYVVIGDLTAAAAVSLRPGSRPLVLFCPRNGLELFWPSRQTQSRSAGNRYRPPSSPDPSAGRKGAAGRSGRDYDQSGVGQDYHLSDHRHDDGLRHELPSGRRSRHGGGAVGLRLRGRPFYLSRP